MQGLDIMPKRTEQNLIVCTGKSEAEVTNNKRYCTVEAKHRQTQSITWPLCHSRASCFIILPLLVQLLLQPIFHAYHRSDLVLEESSSTNL